jgi:hypothetical protein
MPIQMEIARDGRVLVCRFTGTFSMKDIKDIEKEDALHRDKMTPHKVHSLLIFQNVSNLPPGLLSPMRKPPSMFHPNSGNIVLISTNQFVNAIASTVASFGQKDKFRFLTSEEEGWRFLDGLLTQEKQL